METTIRNALHGTLVKVLGEYTAEIMTNPTTLQTSLFTTVQMQVSTGQYDAAMSTAIRLECGMVATGLSETIRALIESTHRELLQTLEESGLASSGSPMADIKTNGTGIN